MLHASEFIFLSPSLKKMLSPSQVLFILETKASSRFNRGRNGVPYLQKDLKRKAHKEGT